MKIIYSLLFLVLSAPIFGQITFLNVSEVANMPEAVSNNAVVEGWINNTPYVYSFGGIDSTKLSSGIHLRSFRYNTLTNIWDTIPSLPDTLGKIAAGASYVDSIIYIIGGYHVYSNHNEASSAKIHRYNPKTNTYLSDGMDIPVPIDDHVQAVWNDSLIYVITGWSNTGNVPNVQIYDPTNDNWLAGTPTANNNTYKAFGASGTIIENTIYYHGGASNGFNFPGQSTLRIGQINPLNPTQITWSTQTTNYITYRAACTVTPFTEPVWLGGAATTYNYNGIAYNGNGGVPLKPTNLIFTNGMMDSIPTSGGRLPMDMRGIAHITPLHNNPTIAYVAGGMIENQEVSYHTYKVDISSLVSIHENVNLSFKTYPNPTSTHINLLFDDMELKTIQLIDVLGTVILSQQSTSNNIRLDVSKYPKGIYFVKVSSKKSSSTRKVIVK